jgi:hypothetical protein
MPRNQCATKLKAPSLVEPKFTRAAQNLMGGGTNTRMVSN